MAMELLSSCGEARFNQPLVNINDSKNSIFKIWNNVASFIENHMLNQKGVSIAGLGVFTFTQTKLDVGNGKYVLIQRPVFQISEKLAQLHNLQHIKYHTPGNIPIVPLNYFSISLSSSSSRESVERCVKDLISSISRTVADNKNVELIFSGIGRLSINNLRVKMRFARDFISMLDGSGDVAKCMVNRPGTADSIFTKESKLSRYSTNTVLFPRPEAPNSAPLSPVPENEYDQTSYMSQDHLTPLPDLSFEKHDENFPLSDKTGDPATDEAFTNIMKGEDNPVMNQTGIRDKFVPSIRADDTLNAVPDLRVSDKLNDEVENNKQNDRSRQTLPVAQVAGISINDCPYLPLDRPREDIVTPKLSFKKLSSRNSFVESRQLSLHLTPLRKSHSRSSIQSESRKEFIENTFNNKMMPKSYTSNSNHKKQSAYEDRSEVKSEDGENLVGCGHPTAGQELCYFCHQHNRRNVPVSFEAQRKHEQFQEEKSIHQLKKLMDMEEFLNEQEKKIARKKELLKVAAFNKGIAEGKLVKAPKKAESSYIFQHRPYTPHRMYKQQEFSQEILKQVNSREKDRKLEEEDRKVVEKLEQSQLVEDLLKERQERISRKNNSQSSYKQALDAQIILKEGNIPSSQENGEYFGKNDMNKEKMEEKRQRARDTMRDQKAESERRKRDAVLRCLAAKKSESEVLDKNTKELHEDMIKQHEARTSQRRSYEKDWQKASELKKQQRSEMFLYDQMPSMCLQEQCRQYRRCNQCNRHLNNIGSCNVWRDTYYTNGSRLMV